MTDDYSAEELERERRRRLIDEARATVDRLKDVEERREKLERQSPEEVARTLLPIAEDRLEKWRREMAVFDDERKEGERELRREARRDRLIRRRYEDAQRAAATPAGDEWNTWCDARIDARLEEERAMVMDIVGECLGELLAKERDATMAALRDQVRELRIEITKLQSEAIEMRTQLALDRAKPVDLPSRRVN